MKLFQKQSLESKSFSHFRIKKYCDVENVEKFLFQSWSGNRRTKYLIFDIFYRIETTKLDILFRVLGFFSVLTYLTFFFDNQSRSQREISAPSSNQIDFQKIQADLPNLPLSYWQQNKEASYLEQFQIDKVS